MAWVGNLTRDEVSDYCPRFEDIQERTTETYRRISGERTFSSSATLGTAVHTDLRNQIRDLQDNSYRAEVSFLKSGQASREAGYGLFNSIRIDALERVDRSTVCIYDIKTGNSGLSMARITEIATTTAYVYPGTRNSIVTEVRPRR
jgi:hypothetical protein